VKLGFGVRLSIALIAAASVSLVLGTLSAPAPAAPAPAPTPTSASAPAAGASVQSLDLNQATRDEIRALPIPSAVADAIYEHRTYQSYFTSIFDLLQIEGMTPELMSRIRPLVLITPVFQSARLEQEEEALRAEELNYVVQRLLSEEGASEGLVDDYIDQIKDPRNVNQLDFFSLISYQNVSPVDARAILLERATAGGIENARQLRAAQGLSYWGFRNLRNFVRYDDPPPGSQRLHADYQVRMYDTPYVLDDADIMNENIVQSTVLHDFDFNTYAGRLNLDTNRPYLTNKLRLRYRQNVKAGFITHRNLGEARWNETAKGFVSIEETKPLSTRLGSLRLHSLVLGNYTVAFGQGLIIDATDFFLPRRAGYGYSVRSIGLRGDLSRSDEFALRGGGAEASLGRLRGTFFYSRDDKDAILNPDGSFNRYIRMVPRLSNDLLAGIRHDINSGGLPGGDPNAFLSMRNVMDERITGSNLALEIAPGTSVGLTGMEIRSHNKLFHTELGDRWNPSDTTLIARLDKRDERDSEIEAGYNSITLGNYRRIWGGEAQTVWNNLALAGEYAKLETSHASGSLARIFSAGPEAFLTQAYLQYENFTVLTLYRDYDLGYDNPYARAFSEDARYEQTLLDGNAFYLKNPYWAGLSRNLPQPKAERGWYFNTRYQFARQFTITGLEYDTWTRKADAADNKRFVVRAEYRPIFPVRLRIRQAMSSRHADRPDDVRNYAAWDSRLELLANLSRFDQLRFLYSTANVKFADRPRLSAPASGGDTGNNTTGQRGSPGHALQAALTHNFNTNLTVIFSAEIYNGFLYNYEDNEFVVVDGTGFRNWFLLGSKLSNDLSWRFKWTNDHSLAHTYVDIRSYGNLVSPTPDAVNSRADRTSFRLQLDYSLQPPRRVRKEE